MSNEEKILEMLATMQADIAAINKRLDVTATKDDLEQVARDSRVMMEAYFDPKFNLLAEDLSIIREKMLPAEAIEDAEDRIDVLEAVVRSHSADIRKLKKAQ